MRHSQPPLRTIAAIPADPKRGGMHEAVANVALAIAEELIVDSQHQRIIAARRRAPGELTGEAPVLVDEDLHPARRCAGGGKVLERAHRAVAETIADAGRARRAGRAALAVRPEQTGKTRRPDDQRHGQLRAEQRYRQIAFAGAAQRARQQLDVGEGLLVSSQRMLVLRTAVGKIENRAWQRGAREAAHGSDAVGAAPPGRCRHVSGPVETIEADGVVTEELALVFRARARDDPVDDFNPLRIGAGKLADVPVAAVHDAVEAERFDRVSDVGLELLARPVLVVGLGRDAGNLAMDVRQAGELCRCCRHGIDHAGLDRRLADMVEHEADLGTVSDHLDHLGQLMVKDADVEGKIVRSQKLQTLEEAGGNAEIGIGLVLDEPPDGTQDPVPAKLLELGRDRPAALERQCRDHSGEPWIGGGKTRDPPRLGEMLGKIDIDLDEDEPVDHHRARRRCEVAGQNPAIERGRVRGPRVAEPLRIAQVNVTVDDREIRHIDHHLGRGNLRRRAGCTKLRSVAIGR